LKYLAQLKGEKRHPDVLTKPTKPLASIPLAPSVSFVSSEGGLISEIDARAARLRRDFELVMSAFRAPADQAQAAWSCALMDPLAAERSFAASAAMLRAGWKPLEEQASAFLGRMVVEEQAAT
jgi:hypothetical protein